MYTTLITAEQLQHERNQGTPLQVFDCSFDLKQAQAGQAQFEEAHIPGALYAHLDTHLSDKLNGDRASGGRHPLPSRERFASWLNQVGFRNDQQAVVYDRQGANYCGRLWWMLKWCGHEDVAVLDGGFAAWASAGGASEGGHPDGNRPPGAFTLKPPLATCVGAQDIARSLGAPSQTLVDARAAARFRGEVEPLDPVAGHIPGALNRPFADNLGADGRFKSPGQLRDEWTSVLAGRDPQSVVHQCGSGVSAVPNLLAMELAGLGRTRLFPGSWSEWCTAPGLPVARN